MTILTFSAGDRLRAAVNDEYQLSRADPTASITRPPRPHGLPRYGYDIAGRLAAISNEHVTISYYYGTNGTSLAATILSTQSGNALTISRNYDSFDRLTELSNRGHSTVLDSFSYRYNATDQRVEVRGADGHRWTYSYNDLGELEKARKYHADGVLVGGGQFAYQYDFAGNRRSARNHPAAHAAARSYSVNNLNQYTSIANPGWIWVTGEAENDCTVTVGTTGAFPAVSSRHAEFFWKLLEVDNAAGAVWTTVVVRAVKQDGAESLIRSETRETLVPPALQQLEYDADGNLVSDGIFCYRWDAENRLVEAASLATVPEGERVRCQFAYDHKGRRAGKVVSSFTNGQWVVRSTSSYVYGDGWQPVLEISAGTTGSFTNGYVWGIDASGAVGEGGGIGGLAAVCRLAVPSGFPQVAFPCYDGNGNVVRLVDSTGTNTLAVYEHGPFGEPLRATETAGFFNAFRFATKPLDPETGLYNFGYRYYSPELGRWLNRDPAGETAERNLYCYVHNDPINSRDPHGLWKDHDKLTEETFDSLPLPTTDKCKRRIISHIITANKRQDSLLSSLWENRRHFNRSDDEDREAARRAYIEYLAEEFQNFHTLLKSGTKDDCELALHALGRITHSWQDFFAHAYHISHGWNAWEHGVRTTPDALGDMYPSSYPGEHPRWHEPLAPDQNEYGLRRRAAVDYVRGRLGVFLNSWLATESCRCYCERSVFF